MLTDTLQITLMGAKAAALGSMLATTALAQTVVETPSGNTAVVTDPALAPATPIGAVTPQSFPLPEQFENDMAVSETLLSQGFTDIRIARNGPIMTVTAQRNGVPTELVYSTANGTLVSVDGVELRDAPDTTSNGQTANSVADKTGAPSQDTPADGDTGTGDGADTDEGAGSDGSDTDGSDTGSDTGAGDGADAGSDTGSDSGSDNGSESSSDGGASDGSDGGSDNNG